MLPAALQALDWALNGHRSLYILFFLWVYFVWATKLIPALFYRPFTAPIPSEMTVAVIIPTANQDAALLRDVLGRIIDQHPNEILVIENGAANPAIRALCAGLAPIVRFYHLDAPGKRGALALGLKEATSEIAVLVDDDTRWLPGTLRELLRPFADPKIGPRVGGVTTRQRIRDRERTIVTRYCDWLEGARFSFGVPAQSVFGQIGVLPGRTFAVRRAPMLARLDLFLEALVRRSDDRHMTILLHMEGLRTVYQSTAEVETESPDNVLDLIRQQLRWFCGSQYYTLTHFGFMLRNTPLALWYFVADILTPFFFLSVLANAAIRYRLGLSGYPFLANTVLAPLYLQLTLSLFSTLVSIAVRQYRRIYAVPSDVPYLPIYAAFSVLILTPLRVAGLILAAVEHGWGTRTLTYR